MPFPAEVAEKLLDAAELAGVPRCAVLGAADVRAGAELSYAELCALYEEGACLTGDDAFGLHVGERAHSSMYGLLGYATAHSETLGQALERLVALQGVWTEAVRFDLTCEGGAARLAYKSRESVPPKARRQETEQMMATAVAFARDRTMADLRPMSVRFEHEAPPHTQEHSRIFGCALFFGSPVTELSLKADALSLPLAAADLTLGSLIRAQAESVLAARIRQQPMMEVVRSSVAAALAGGQAPALAEAAKAAGFGSRTLQRRLREQDSSWRAVVDEVRITTAKKLLAYSRMSLAQIAFRTGFSQQSALQRAFQRLEGITPRQYRLHAVARQERR